MRPTSIAAAAALLALSACGPSNSPEDPPPPSASPTFAVETADPEPEGPATKEARWPDNVTAKLVKVERVPNKWGVDVPADQAIIRVTWQVTNGGTVPLAMEQHTKFSAIYFGANRMPGEAEAGYGDSGREALQNDNPTRIAVGKTVTFVESESGPANQLDELAVELRLPTATVEGDRPWTFTGAQEMLTTVKG